MTASIFRIRPAFTVALVFCCSCTSPIAPALWKAIPQTSGTVILTPQSIRSLSVALSIAELRKLHSEERITLILPADNATAGLTVVAHVVVSKQVRDEQFVWRGTIEGDPESVVTLSFSKNTLVGDIQTSRGKMYRARIVKPTSKDRIVGIVEELDPTAFPREERGAQRQLNADSAPGNAIQLTLPPGKVNPW